MGQTKSEATETLGTILDACKGRDAIHVGCISVQATSKLYPGEHVNASGESTTPWVGIVDPFLPKPVQPGQWFWLLLYPRTCTTLRHVWTHPAFKDEPVKVAVPVNSTGQGIDVKAASQQWLHDYADKVGISYEALIAAVKNKNWDSEYLIINGEDACGDIDPNLWHHLDVLGIKYQYKPQYFSCAC